MNLWEIISGIANIHGNFGRSIVLTSVMIKKILCGFIHMLVGSFIVTCYIHESPGLKIKMRERFVS